MATILIVDDRPMDRELLISLFTYAHYRVLEAADGVEALRLVQTEHPDLVVSDVLLPVMDGYEVVRRLRTDPDVARTAVIFYTAVFNEQEARDLARECGVARILSKPTDPEKILEIVAQVLQASGTDGVSTPPADFELKHQRLLVDKLIWQMKTLHQSHDQLERVVRERTADLAQRNEELTIEIAERLKMEQSLRESREQLRILAFQVLAAQENERKRIALEIHDVLGSSLSAIKYKAEEALQNLPKDRFPNISKPLEALIPIVQDTIEEVRRIQADLRPPLLDDLGIAPTLSWFCRRFETIYSGIRIEQAVSIREEEVPDYLKIAIYRIIQEAMNNIGKHAKADSVYLGLRKVGDAIELYVRDNGEGFDPDRLSSREISKKGLGLSSMKERVEFSGGSFFIESAKGKGTVICAAWPV